VCAGISENQADSINTHTHPLTIDTAVFSETPVLIYQIAWKNTSYRQTFQNTNLVHNSFNVYFLLGISPASYCSWPTFRKLYQFHLQRLGVHHTVHPAFEDGTDTGFRNVGKLQFDAGELPKRKYTIFKSRRKSEIKNSFNLQQYI